MLRERQGGNVNIETGGLARAPAQRQFHRPFRPHRGTRAQRRRLAPEYRLRILCRHALLPVMPLSRHFFQREVYEALTCAVLPSSADTASRGGILRGNETRKAAPPCPGM